MAKYLPSEIIINILSRLPLRSISICKCVSKSWLHLLETDEFINSHLSNSAPGLAIFQQARSSESYQIYEFEDKLDLTDHQLHYNFVTRFKLPFTGMIQGSANGFLFLRDFTIRHNRFYICNPITREYIEIHTPKEFDYTYPQVVTFGFGVSKVTSQHKVVRVFHDRVLDQDTHKLLRIFKSECYVYTLGSGSWRRSTNPSPPFEYDCRSTGAFFNGILHWLVCDLDGKRWISCMDLEHEVFSIISPPPPFRDETVCTPAGVHALGDCLSICCTNSSSNEIIVWLMMEYGDEKSWTKKFVIGNSGGYCGEFYDVPRPIKVFKDGDILMAWGDFAVFYSSRKSRDISKISIFDELDVDSILHTSSFLALKSFGTEEVVPF